MPPISSTAAITTSAGMIGATRGRARAVLERRDWFLFDSGRFPDSNNGSCSMPTTTPVCHPPTEMRLSSCLHLNYTSSRRFCRLVLSSKQSEVAPSQHENPLIWQRLTGSWQDVEAAPTLLWLHVVLADVVTPAVNAVAVEDIVAKRHCRGQRDLAA